MQLNGGFTAASANVQSLVGQGFLPVRFAYVTGGSSQTGPAGTQFFATSNFPQFLSIDLGFRSVELLAGPAQGGVSGSVLLTKDVSTDRMGLSASDSATNTSISLSFIDTRRFLPSQAALPSPFPSASAFSASNNGFGGPAPAFGFEVFFTFNGQSAWVRGDLFPSALSTAPIPPGLPAPSATALLALAGAAAARRRRG
jgi:MYXO-CTERM domain-containing protein